MTKYLIKEMIPMEVIFNFLILFLGNYYNIKKSLNEESVLLFTQIVKDGETKVTIHVYITTYIHIKHIVQLRCIYL